MTTHLSLIRRGQRISGPLASDGSRATRPGAGRGATAGRLLLGFYFLAMVLVNLFITLPSAKKVYAGLVDLTWPGFVWIPEQVIEPVAGPFTMALIAWECTVGVLLLSRGRAVRLGLWAVLFQVLALAPFLGWYEIPNLLTAVLVVWLLRREHDRSVPQMLGAHRSGPRLAHG
jgi:hypothetical protein